MANSFPYADYFDTPSVKGRTFAQFRTLMARLGVQERDFRCIHVAGTNGKGSTCAYLESILLQANMDVGCFTSPALVFPNERLRMNGDSIDDDSLARLAEQVSAAEDALGTPLGGFDRMYATALLYFKEQAPDWIIVETGIGGRSDITNAMPAEISIITSISLDHTEMLGDSLPAIAGEKAGIVHTGQRCAILQPQQPEVMTVLRARCAERKVPIRQVEGSALRNHRTPTGQDVFYSLPGGVTLRFRTRMLGSFQCYNLAAAVLAVRELDIDGIAIAEGVQCAFWPGRLEHFPGDPPVLLDGAHNPDGMRALMDALGQFFPNQSPVVLCGIGAKKDAAAMLDAMKDRVEILITLPIDETDRRNSTPPEELARMARERGIPAQCCQDMERSFEEALSYCASMEEKNPLILVCGSLYLVGSMRAYLLKRQDYQSSYASDDCDPID